MRKIYFLLFSIMLTITSCQVNKATVSSIKPSLKGIWRMQGYGQLLVISDTAIAYYDITQKSCLPVKSIPFSELSKLGEVKKVTQDSLLLKNSITEYQLLRLQLLPDLCASQDRIRDKNPIYNFEVFWQTFKENYAFFKERNIDWDKIYSDSQSKISNTTTDIELASYIKGIIAKLNDGHTTFNGLEIAPESDANTTADETTATKVDRKDLREAILKKIAPDFKSAGRDIYGNGLVNWAITKENIGYLQVNWMIFYADFGIPETATTDEFVAKYFEESEAIPSPQEKELAAFRKIMAQVVADFKNVKGVILDVRLNGGGYDAISLELLRHFVTEKTLAFTKKAILPNGSFTKKQELYLLPSPPEERLAQPLIILTSPNTASAAEILSISSMAMKNVRRIGSNTEGIFSDVLNKKLPNGWEFSLSNQVYGNFEGKNFENIGIPPTTAVEYPKGDFFYLFLSSSLSKGDEAMEKALEELRQ